MTFEEFSLDEAILQAVVDMGFTEATPVQEAVIPVVLNEESDIVALAQTGTGKTAAFGLPILEKLKQGPREIGALVLCPTRELAIQITKEMRAYAAKLPHLVVDVVYGGAAYGDQIRALQRGVHILVATPGRLLDLINKGKADLSTLDYLVLDEADIMLNMGFKEELDAILEAAPADRRTILLSATMPQEVSRIAATYMKEPQHITVGKKNAAAEGVEHSYYLVRGNEKYAALKRLVDYHPEMYGIVFCRTKAATQDIADKLIGDGYNAEALHGDLSQMQRELVMNKFRRRTIQLLVATDVAARGLDVQDLSHVIHYDLPDESEMYTHRSGRTGRAGKSGISYALIGTRERRRVQSFERQIKSTIRPGRIPGGEDIFRQQLEDYLGRLSSMEVNEEQIAPYLSLLSDRFDDVDKETLIKKLVSMQFEQMLDYYHDLPDISAVDEKHGGERGGRNTKGGGRGGRIRGVEAGYENISINLGKRDRMAPPQLIGLVNRCSPVQGVDIGKIDIDLSYSNVQVEEEYAAELAEALNGLSFRGRKIRAQLGLPAQRGQGGKGKHRKTPKKSSKPRRPARSKKGLTWD